EKIIAAGGEGYFPFRLWIATNIESDTGSASRFEFRTRLPELGLCEIRRADLCDEKEVEFANVIKGDGTLRTRDLREELFVGRNPCGSSELIAGFLETEE